MRPDCPRARDDLRYYERTGRDGAMMVIVYDPVLNQYHQLDELQALILRAFDGAHTLQEIADRLTRELDAEIPMEVLREFVRKVRGMYLLDVGSAAGFSEVEGQRVRRAIERAARDAGVRFSRAGEAGAQAPERRERTDLRQLFDSALRMIEAGDPVQAMRLVHAVLEASPGNARAGWLKAELHKASLLARRPPQPWYNLRLELFSPEKVLDRILSVAGFLGSPRFYFVLLGAFFVAAGVAFAHLDGMVSDLTRVPDAIFRYPWLVPLGWGMTVWLLLGHEICHGLACRRYGGRVPTVGLILIFFLIPGAYCDTSATYTFESRWQRVHVAMAGIAWQMLNYLWIVPLYVLTTRESPLHWVSLMGMMECWTTVLFVLVPAFKNDGYYAISDALGIPNLYGVASKFWTTRLQRWFLGLPPEEGDVALAQQGGWGVGLYGAMNIFTMAWLTISAYFTVTVPMMTTALRGPGLLIATFPVAMFIGMPVRRLYALLRSRWAEVRRSFRARVTATAALAGAALLAVTPIPRSVTLPYAIAERGQGWAQVESTEAGVLLETLVREGDVVTAGQVVARLDPGPALEALEAAEVQLAVAELELSLVERPNEAAVAAARASATWSSRLAEVQRRALSRDARLAASGLLSADDTSRSVSRAVQAAGAEVEARARLKEVSAKATPELVATLRRMVEAAREQVRLRRERLEALELRSPAAGTVAWAIAGRGDVAGKGIAIRPGELVARVRTAEPLTAVLEIPIEYAGLVERLQPVRLRLASQPSPVRTAVGTIEERAGAQEESAMVRGRPMVAAATRLAGQAINVHSALVVRTEPFAVDAPGGARGDAVIALTPLTGLEWLGWQLKYFVGYFWWSLW